MFENRTRVLLILPEDVLEEARMLAGRETARLKLTVSLQVVLRALIEEGLKRTGDPSLQSNVESQARAVRRFRALAGRRGGGGVRGASPPLRLADGGGMAKRANGSGAEPPARLSRVSAAKRHPSQAGVEPPHAGNPRTPSTPRGRL